MAWDAAFKAESDAAAALGPASVEIVEREAFARKQGEVLEFLGVGTLAAILIVLATRFHRGAFAGSYADWRTMFQDFLRALRSYVTRRI